MDLKTVRSRMECAGVDYPSSHLRHLVGGPNGAPAYLQQSGTLAKQCASLCECARQRCQPGFAAVESARQTTCEESFEPQDPSH